MGIIPFEILGTKYLTKTLSGIEFGIMATGPKSAPLYGLLEEVSFSYGTICNNMDS